MVDLAEESKVVRLVVAGVSIQMGYLPFLYCVILVQAKTDATPPTALQYDICSNFGGNSLPLGVRVGVLAVSGLLVSYAPFLYCLQAQERV